MPTRNHESLADTNDSSLGTTESSPKKKARKSDYQSYGGFRRRHCICQHGSECTEAWKAFIDVKDTRRCGHYYVKTSTSRAASVKEREVIYAHLFPKIKLKPPDPKGHDEYVACHHFDPLILQDNNGGPLKEVNAEKAGLVGLQRSDLQPGKTSVYFAAPNYSHHCWKRDAASARAALVPGVLRSQEACLNSEDEESVSVDRTFVRPSPFHRACEWVKRWVLSNPEEASMEIVKLREQLEVTQQSLNISSRHTTQLKNKLELKEAQLKAALEREQEMKKEGGVSRNNFTNEAWHKDHPKMAHHWWGLGKYSHARTYITEVFFPNVKPTFGSGREPCTEYEEVLVCLMRMHRNYESQSLCAMWGRKSPSWASAIFQKWMPRLGRVGLYMSILDLDFTVDYISREEADRLGLPHYLTSNQLGQTSYTKATVPVQYINLGYGNVGALVDGKVFMTETVRINSAINRMLYAEKVDNSGGLVMTWTTPTGLCFEHTGLYFARCPEVRLVELWGTQDPNKIRFATDE